MNTDQREKAKKLYFQSDLSIADIADALGISRRTIHFWIRENNWDIQKENAAHMPAMIAENCYHIIAKYTQQLLSPERADTMITHREADTLYKLTITLNKLKGRITLNENMEVMAGFIEHVNEKSDVMADCVMPFVDSYIATRAKASGKKAPQAQTKRRSEEEEERERQLDLEDELAWSAAGDPIMNRDNNTVTPTPAPLSNAYEESNFRRFSDTLQDNPRHNAEARPTYQQFIDDLRKQDEHLKHLFPINTKTKLQAA